MNSLNVTFTDLLTTEKPAIGLDGKAIDRVLALKPHDIVEPPKQVCGKGTSFYEIFPRGLNDYDEGRVVVVVPELAADFARHRYISLLAVATLLGLKVVLLPADEQKISRFNRSAVAMGDLDSLVGGKVADLEELIGKASVTFVGLSAGAQQVPVYSRIAEQRFNNDSVALLDPPNVEDRHVLGALRRDFLASGGDAWRDAARAANILALTDAVEPDLYRAIDGFLFLERLATSPSQIAIARALGRATLGRDLRNMGYHMPDGSSVVVARAQDSAMTKEAPLLAQTRTSLLGQMSNIAHLGVYSVRIGDERSTTDHSYVNNPFAIAAATWLALSHVGANH